MDKHTVQVSQYFECLGPSGGSEERPLNIPQPLPLSPAVARKVSALTSAAPAMKDALLLALRGHHASLDLTSPSAAGLLLCDITQDTEGGRRLLRSWATDAQRALDGWLRTLAVDEEAMTAAEFAEAEAELRGLAGQTGGELGFVYRDQEQEVCIVFQARSQQRVADDVKAVIRATKKRLDRAKRVKSETMTVAAAEVTMLQKCRAEEGVQRKFPDLSVTYDVEGGTVVLKGVAAELTEIRLVIAAKLKEIVSSTHASAMTSRLLLATAAQTAVRDACLEADPAGAVRLEPGGFTVYAFGGQRAELMQRAGLAAIQKKDIHLGEEHREATTLPAFDALLASLRGDLLVIDRRSPSSLVLVGVSPAFQEAVDALDAFLRDHSLRRETFPMEGLQQDLFKLHLRTAPRLPSSVRPDDVTYDADRAQITATGTPAGLRETQAVVDDFLARVLTQPVEFPEPSFGVYLHSPDGRRKLRQVQASRTCAIVERAGEALDQQGAPLSLDRPAQAAAAAPQPVRRAFAKPPQHTGE